MNNKDYTAIAKALNDSVIGANSHVNKEVARTEMLTTEFIANSLIKYMCEADPKFDRKRFAEACGIVNFNWKGLNGE